MTTTSIEIIPVLPFGMLNAYLIVTGDSAVLVDTGLPNSCEKVENALWKYELDWSNLRLVVLTHAHIDHAGSAVDIQALSSAPVLAHKAEVPYCQGRAPLLRPSGIFGRVFRTTRAIQQPFTYFTPDIIMGSQEVDLETYGIPARVTYTPGHTPGSISVILKDGRVIAGDLLASGILLGGIAFRNRPKQPPFEEDTHEVARSLEGLLKSNCHHFFLGHGGPLFAPIVKKHVQKLRSL
ncbi:MBL fold metallo-hydrolase [Ruegeria sp. EL01]|jgi:glyoxylase-like metal-dependent hydrolase (beta-lactamase superfamily II)|uniref:MBL fold metallo-hydrolase n=1 Tax=Ruegeria sp. EL01 TaxID=2107578 RepID=UPI000EA80156|nr:MBL fold metallo-hydrolase [Ruegeria sp. EL01]